MCQRVLRFVVSSVGQFGEYSLSFETRDDGHYCYVNVWEDSHLKRICVSVESVDGVMPDVELVPFARVACSVAEQRMPVAIQGCSPTLVRVLSGEREDGRTFIAYKEFSSDVFLKCFRQAHQDVFGMLEITTLLDYLVQRLKTALYEEWTEGKLLLRKSIRQGYVTFVDMRGVCGELLDVWGSVRPYVRYTGLPHLKDRAERVGLF